MHIKDQCSRKIQSWNQEIRIRIQDMHKLEQNIKYKLTLALRVSIKVKPVCRLDSDLDGEANLKESLSSYVEVFFPQEDDDALA